MRARDPASPSERRARVGLPLGLLLAAACTSAPRPGVDEPAPPRVPAVEQAPRAQPESALDPRAPLAAQAATQSDALDPRALAADGQAPPAGAAASSELAQAREAFEQGDLLAARAALDELLARPFLEAARAHLREERLDAALQASAQALELAPTHAPSLLLHGECLAGIALRDGDRTRLQEALDTLRRASRSSAALFAASRVARELGRAQEALELARRAARLEGVDPALDPDALSPLPPEPGERTLAEAALLAWRGSVGAGEAVAPRELFAEAEEALARLLSRRPADAWGWRALAEAYLEAGRPAEARAALERALDRLPRERELIELLARASGATRVPGALLEAFGRLQRKRPGVGLYWWYPAVGLFKDALPRGPTARNLFADSEAAFRACREKDPTLRADCLRYEALCRTGQGWCWVDEGRLDQATAWFRSGEDLLPDALDLAWEERLASARVGLQRVLELHLERQHLPQAAEVAALLFHRSPRDVRLARQSGLLNRDLGDHLMLLARDYRLAVRGKLQDSERLEQLRADCGIESALSPGGKSLRGTGREQDIFRATAGHREREAQEAYRRGYEALRMLVELEPDDLRALSDASEIAVQRLGTDLQWAEQELLRGFDRGERLLAESGLEGEELFALKEAWGDVAQLLGVLYLERKKAPLQAESWFVRCLEIGPLPRAAVSDHYLPRCRNAGG